VDIDVRIGVPLGQFREAVRNWSAAEMRWRVIPQGDHLSRLMLPETVEVSWWRSLAAGVRDLFRPLPPLDVTSKPVLVKDIWGQYGRQKKSWVVSVGLQSAAVAGVFAMAVSPVVRQQVRERVTLIAPVDAPLELKKPAVVRPKGGGGGGDRSILPASYGRLARFAREQFTPPAAVVPNPQARLTVDPTLIGAPELNVAKVDLPIGDPWGKIGPASNGPGSGGGVGSGHDGGQGPGGGPGGGLGEGGGLGNVVWRMGTRGVTAPELVTKIEPEYSEEARKAKYQGTVELYVEVDPSGRARNMRVLHSLGLGLDDKAMEAVAKWRFKPGTKDGKAVTVMALIEVTFRLL
jgi:periplasmic protein TonB